MAAARSYKCHLLLFDLASTARNALNKQQDPVKSWHCRGSRQASEHSDAHNVLHTPVKHSCRGSAAVLMNLKPGLTVITCCPPVRSCCTAKLTLRSLPVLTLSDAPPG